MNFLQARDTIADKIVGHFETSDSQVQLTDCDAREANTLTHKNAQKKDRITASWIVPNDIIGQKSVKFYYTVVEEKPKFWVLQESPEIILNSSRIFKASLITIGFSIFIMKLFQKLEML